MAEQTAEQRLAEANDILIGAVENGPWVLITDPALRQIVGEYVAETCHSVASAAGLDEAMERAHDAMTQRLATALPGQRTAAQCAATYPEAPAHDRRCVQPEGHQPAVALHYNRAGFAWADDEVLSAVMVDARERLARHLWIADGGNPQTWDRLGEADAQLANYNRQTGSALRLDGAAARKQFLTAANQIIAAITGQEHTP